MIHVIPSTRAILDGLRALPAGKKPARTLAASRFIDFRNDNRDPDWRRRSSAAVREGAITPAGKLASWRAFALGLAGPAQEKSPRLLFARQASRLIINMSGGVFENGGLSLDRLSGVPVIPGNAVKGCARRLAVAALQEWTSGQLVSGDAENVLHPVIVDFSTPADLLVQIALIFGSCDLEWKGREDFRNDNEWQEQQPDFAWACGEQWTNIRRVVTTKLCGHFGITPEDTSKPWKSLPHFAGSIGFLPALPWEKDPGIDLDVITSHHSGYYASADPCAVATDTEEPVPVIFPVIAPGQVWLFLLHPTSRALDTHLSLVRVWLATGVGTLGIGAKTNAGYGWFDATESVQKEIVERITREQEEEELNRRSKEAKDVQAAAARKARLEDGVFEAALTGLPPEEQEDCRLERLNEEQFDAKVRAFCKVPRKGGPSDVEKEAIVRALRGTRSSYWQELKKKATKGELAQIDQAIRKLSKDMKLGKMP